MLDEDKIYMKIIALDEILVLSFFLFEDVKMLKRLL
jgi:hypothetical protein